MDLFDSLKGMYFVYGAPGTGKTTLAMQLSLSYLRNKKKVVYIDTENGFSVERFNQISKDNKLLDNVLHFPASNFYFQKRYVKQILELLETKKIGLIIMDSISNHFRRFYSKDKNTAVSLIKNQLKILQTASDSGIPVIITSQVYNSFKNGITPIAFHVFEPRVDTILHLLKDPRVCKFEKGRSESFNFEIKEEGITFSEMVINN